MSATEYGLGLETKVTADRPDLPVYRDLKDGHEAVTLATSATPKEKPSSVNTTEGFRIFYSTADTEKWDAQTGLGDVDYGASLAIGMNRLYPHSACFIRDLYTETEIYNFIETHKQPGCPAVLQVLRNAPRFGSAFTVGGLESFKKRGNKVVVTAVEFAKHESRQNGRQYMQDIVDLLRVADQIVFLDKFDKDSALKFCRAMYPKEASLQEKIEIAKVIPVPPTVEIAPPRQLRGRDIISFGMIRAGKGLAHLRKLAGLLKSSKHPEMQNKKILIVGSILHAPTDTKASHETIQLADIKPKDAGYMQANKELYRLMWCIYPQKRAELEIINRKFGNTLRDDKLNIRLKQELNEYQQNKIEAALPIEIYPDIPESELGPLFERATYNYLPAYRGATLRNTSYCCSLEQAETGLVTITQIGEITPDELMPLADKKMQVEENYTKAMVLMPDDEFGTGDDKTLQYSHNGYAARVYDAILEREKNPKLNEETLLVARELLKTKICREAVAKQHLTIYQQILQEELKKKYGFPAHTPALILSAGLAVNTGGALPPAAEAPARKKSFNKNP